MSKESRRAHVVLPDDLLHEVDDLVGPRKRSEFFVDAAREKIMRERLRGAAHEVAGSLKDERIPGWDTLEATSTWVHSGRADSDDRAFSNDRPE